MDRGIIELEFDISDTEFFLVRASNEASCDIRLEELFRRSDGKVVEFLSLRGTDPERVLELAAEAPVIYEARLLRDDGEEALFEFVSESAIATALVDEETRVTDITATAGDGRLRAEVPPHVDATTVIDSFLAAHPSAELIAKRTLDREAPLFTPAQGREAMLAEFTDKQLQALRTAHAGGYYDWPREVTAEEVAVELDLASSTFAQHLRAAERKVFDALFD